LKDKFKNVEGWACKSVVEHLLSMWEGLDLIPSVCGERGSRFYSRQIDPEMVSEERYTVWSDLM
jgi:hypothetical protein